MIGILKVCGLTEISELSLLISPVLEAELWPAYNPMYSDVTASTCRGVEIWGEIKIGYKFSFYRKLFIQPAPGIGYGIFRTNKPPKFNEDINNPIFAPQLIIGLKL